MSGPRGPAYIQLTPGDPLPRFVGHAHGPRRLAWDAMAGRYLLICTFMTTGDPEGRAAAKALAREAGRFDDQFASALAVTIDSYEQSLAGCGPGVHVVRDLDGVMCRVLGTVPGDTQTRGLLQYTRRSWILVDPTLHVLAIFPFEEVDEE